MCQSARRAWRTVQAINALFYIVDFRPQPTFTTDDGMCTNLSYNGWIVSNITQLWNFRFPGNAKQSYFLTSLSLSSNSNIFFVYFYIFKFTNLSCNCCLNVDAETVSVLFSGPFTPRQRSRKATDANRNGIPRGEIPFFPRDFRSQVAIRYFIVARVIAFSRALGVLHLEWLLLPRQFHAFSRTNY